MLIHRRLARYRNVQVFASSFMNFVKGNYNTCVSFHEKQIPGRIDSVFNINAPLFGKLLIMENLIHHIKIPSIVAMLRCRSPLHVDICGVELEKLRNFISEYFFSKPKRSMTSVFLNSTEKSVKIYASSIKFWRVRPSVFYVTGIRMISFFSWY